jgi:hypothetical protein
VDRLGDRCLRAWRTQLQRSMRPLPVVVPRVLGKDATQVSLAEDQHPVGDLGADGQHKAFGEGIATRAYAHPDPREGETLLARVIDSLRAAVPAGLDELVTLGRTLARRRDDVLAYFTHRASNGPTEPINGRLEALRRNALGFRNLINYRIRSLLHCGALPL